MQHGIPPFCSSHYEADNGATHTVSRASYHAGRQSRFSKNGNCLDPEANILKTGPTTHFLILGPWGCSEFRKLPPICREDWRDLIVPRPRLGWVMCNTRQTVGNLIDYSRSYYIECVVLQATRVVRLSRSRKWKETRRKLAHAIRKLLSSSAEVVRWKATEAAADFQSLPKWITIWLILTLFWLLWCHRSSYLPSMVHRAWTIAAALYKGLVILLSFKGTISGRHVNIGASIIYVTFKGLRLRDSSDYCCLATFILC